MEFSSHDGEDDGKNIGVGFVEIYKIFAMHDTCLIETEPFDIIKLSE